MTSVPAGSPLDALRVTANVLLPMVAGGAIARRPRVMALAQRLDLDTRAVGEMQRLRGRYGPGPLQVRVPGRRFTFLLEPDHVHRVLNGSPEPFSPATREKRGALGHFQPAGVLVSSPAERVHRRPFNEAVLEPGRTVHEHGRQMAEAIEEEMATLLGHVRFSGSLTWDDFTVAWWRMVRRIVLGDGARDDDAVTDDLLRLRKDANWSFFKPRRTALMRRFLARVEEYVERAEPGSLAAMAAATPAHPGTEPHQQVPQWLFAFDAGAWATFRALALVMTKPGAADQGRAELTHSPDLPYLRACVLESVRLWATTPLILRDTTRETTWESGTLPAGASVVLFAPFFHRDAERLPQAHTFTPELWLHERTDADWPLVPFSGGPAMCPGRDVVLLAACTALGHLVAGHDYTVSGMPRTPAGTAPGTLSPFGLEFRPVPTAGG